MQSWLKKGTVKRELDKETNESTVPLDGADGGSCLVTKKIKKEENSPTK
jgi:hypothetical protein